jgi:hypothetical protein
MIPIGPLIWAVIAASRALKRRKSAPTSLPTPTPLEVLRFILAAILPLLTAGLLVLLLVVITPTLVASSWGALYVTFWVVTWGGMLFAAPRWLAWRVARPLGLPGVARALLWLSLPGKPPDRRGFAQLVAAEMGRPLPREGKQLDAVTAWSTCAAALQAERLSDPDQADRLLRPLYELPNGARFPWAVRAIAFESLCRTAAARGDWETLKRRAELGRGRAVWLLRRVAAAHTGGTSALALWGFWLLAPERRKSLPLVKAIADAPRPLVTEPASEPKPRGGSPFQLHFALLSKRAAGGAASSPELRRLVRAWERKLDARDEAQLRARGLELGVRDAAAAARSIRRAVLDELEALSGVAHGRPHRFEGETLAAELSGRSRDRLFAALQPFLQRFRGEAKELGSPMEEWQQWVRFREAVEAVETALGTEGLTTAWHAGVRNAAWNWPCKVLNGHKPAGAWASLVMFSWVADLAAKVGDAEAERVNRKNVEVARPAAAAL